MILDVADLVELAAADHRVVEHLPDRRGQGFGAVQDGQDRLGDVQASSRSPTSRPRTRVVFSVDPSTTASGCFTPSIPMPNATTHRWSAKWTPSIMIATRSSPDRSAASRSLSAVSVIATNFRDTADLLVDFASASTCAPTGSNATG